MKKLIRTLLLMGLIAGACVTQAQTRYLNEIFTDVQIDTSIIYEQNYDYAHLTTLQPLIMDVYRPVGDTATHRPVILLSHNGSFLPEVYTHLLAGLCFNGIKDSSIVELCKRFAKRGYVAVSFNYRLGWNATSNDQEVRTATIIQAVYRAMQDSKALVRYFKNDYANNGNSWGVDTGKFVIGGTNSGAYVALAAGSLNDTSDLSNLKFVGSNGPFIKQDTLGDFDGFGGVENHDNYPGISSRFECVLALGGAVGDTSWIKAGQPPVIAFQGVNESGTPYNTNIVTTTTGQPVVEVSGSGDFMPYVDALGNNNVFKPNSFEQGPPNINGNGVQTTSLEGLYPFYGEEFEPWNWYDPTCYNSSQQMQTLNPGSNPTKGNLYIDTIMSYTLPRLYKLFIDPSFTSSWNGIQAIKEENVQINLFPNPASTEINISVAGGQTPISDISLFDITGRSVTGVSHVGSLTKIMDVSAVNNGIYLVTVKFADGAAATRRLVIER